MILTLRLKEMTAATFEPKLGTGTRAAADAIAVGETRSETKNWTQEKASCWQQDMKINKLVLPRKNRYR